MLYSMSLRKYDVKYASHKIQIRVTPATMYMCCILKCGHRDFAHISVRTRFFLIMVFIIVNLLLINCMLIKHCPTYFFKNIRGITVLL